MCPRRRRRPREPQRGLHQGVFYMINCILEIVSYSEMHLLIVVIDMSSPIGTDALLLQSCEISRLGRFPLIGAVVIIYTMIANDEYVSIFSVLLVCFIPRQWILPGPTMD